MNRTRRRFAPRLEPLESKAPPSCAAPAPDDPLPAPEPAPAPLEPVPAPTSGPIGPGTS